MTNQDNKQLLLIVGKNFRRELIFQLYDLESDKWYPEKRVTKEKLPDFVEDTMFCLIGSKVYFMITQKDGIVRKEICSFDLISNEITRVEWNYEVDIWKGTVIDNYIYFYDMTKNLWYFDTTTKEARICTRLKDLHFPYGIQGLNGIIYILGTSKMGWQDSSESYNHATGEVKYVSSLPLSQIKTTGHYIRNAALNGKLYVINSDSLAKIFVFTPEDNSWEIINAQNNPPSFDNGKLTSCNGFLIGCNFRCWIYIYHFDDNVWECRKNYKGSVVDGKAILSIDKIFFYNQEL